MNLHTLSSQQSGGSRMQSKNSGQGENNALLLVGLLMHTQTQENVRILLNKVREAKCYEDIRTIGRVVHPTYKPACFALGLLERDGE